MSTDNATETPQPLIAVGAQVDRGVRAPVDLATVLRCAAYSAYTLTLSGGAPPGAFQWFTRVEPGQMVIETSTMFQRSRDRYGIGWLVKKTREPMPFDEWPDDEPVPQDDCWYIECLDGVIYRWTNADFVRVPETVNPWRDR